MFLRISNIWEPAQTCARGGILAEQILIPKNIFAIILRQDAEPGGKDTVSGWKPEYLTDRGDKVLPQKKQQKTFGKNAKC